MRFGPISITFEKRKKSTLANPEQRLLDALGSQPTSSGIRVTEENAMRASAVFACVRILAETVASLPVHVYRRLPAGGKERATKHPLYSLLHDLPNPEITSFSFRETAMAHLCLWGNAYAEIEYDGAGRIRALWPLPPWRVQVERDPATQRLKYIVTLDNGERQALDVSRVFHVPALSFNGLVGISPIRWAAREAIGLALATEQFGARFFDQGTNIGGVVTHPKTLSEQASRNLRESINETYAGLGKSHRIMLLEEGMKYERIGIPPEEAQFLETRKFQVTEIARIFRVPPHMLADLERATFSNIEHQSIEFVTHTIRPWLVRWEQAIYRDLLFPDERKEYFVEFNVDGLLRGDIESRYRAYAIGRQWGWLSANDIREMENKNPIPGGDVYWAPVNMIPAEMMAAQNVEPEDAPPERATREARAIRAAKGRQRTASTFRPVFEDAARRIIRREEADVMRSARKMIGQRDTNSFLAWLEDFYREHKEFILAVLAAPLRSLAEAIQAEAAEEIGAPVGLTPSLEEFLNAYLEGYADRHVGSSLGQLRSVLLDAVQAGEDPVEKLQQRFDEWAERRPTKIARWETVRASNAVAKATYIENGVTKLRWVTLGANCPYCSRLNGKVVGINSDFVGAGEAVEADGVEPMYVYNRVGHAPLHEGCDCQIMADI